MKNALHANQKSNLRLETKRNETNGQPEFPGSALLIPAVLVCTLVCMLAGCAEGMFWRSGQYAPWVRDKWAAEEQIADTLFSRKRQMNEMVNAVKTGPVEAQEPVATKLTAIVNRDPILLMRLHAVKLLGELNCPTSIIGLTDASSDHVSDVRIEAVRSWSRLPGQIAVPRLQQMIGSDTNVDVRMAATRALGNFPGQQSVRALSLALDDQNPAIQIRATESLARVTGENQGRNVEAWKQYVAGVVESNPIDMSMPGGEATSQSHESVAESPGGIPSSGEFRR